jgi:hypothetical protein
MGLLRGTRPLKRWRYVALFCEELMACAARVCVGPARQSFWAIFLREEGLGFAVRGRSVLERTRLIPRGGALELPAGALRVRDTCSGDGRGRHRRGHDSGRRRHAVALEATLAEGGAIEAVCAHGADGYVWTRKQAGVPARVTLSLDGGAPRTLEALAVIDDTAGYHARATEWWWAAGVGVDPRGTALAFNLVEGVNDPPRGSERAVWIAGAPREAPPVRFAADLSSVAAADGSRLLFAAEAQRARRENLVVVRSEYRAPFGSFSGTLPGGVELAHGLGVVEHHRARW